MQINKKVLLSAGFAIILVLCMLLWNNKTKKNKNANDVANKTNEITDGVLFDEETGLYYLKNNETNEIIYASRNKEELQIYIDFPDYNPNPLAQKKTTLEEYMTDYMYMEENENINEE